MKNLKKTASKKSKFNNWVAREYKKIHQEGKYSGIFEKKMDPRINIIIQFFIKDIKLDNKTSKEKKEILFHYFLTILEEDEITRKVDFTIDEKFETEDTIKERQRILRRFSKKPKKRCFYRLGTTAGLGLN